MNRGSRKKAPKTPFPKQEDSKFEAKRNIPKKYRDTNKERQIKEKHGMGYDARYGGEGDFNESDIQENKNENNHQNQLDMEDENELLYGQKILLEVTPNLKYSSFLYRLIIHYYYLLY